MAFNPLGGLLSQRRKNPANANVTDDPSQAPYDPSANGTELGPGANITATAPQGQAPYAPSAAPTSWAQPAVATAQPTPAPYAPSVNPQAMADKSILVEDPNASYDKPGAKPEGSVDFKSFQAPVTLQPSNADAVPAGGDAKHTAQNDGAMADFETNSGTAAHEDYGQKFLAGMATIPADMRKSMDDAQMHTNAAIAAKDAPISGRRKLAATLGGIGMGFATMNPAAGINFGMDIANEPRKSAAAQQTALAASANERTKNLTALGGLYGTGAERANQVDETKLKTDTFNYNRDYPEHDLSKEGVLGPDGKPMPGETRTIAVPKRFPAGTQPKVAEIGPPMADASAGGLNAVGTGENVTFKDGTTHLVTPIKNVKGDRYMLNGQDVTDQVDLKDVTPDQAYMKAQERITSGKGTPQDAQLVKSYEQMKKVSPQAVVNVQNADMATRTPSIENSTTTTSLGNKYVDVTGIKEPKIVDKVSSDAKQAGVPVITDPTDKRTLESISTAVDNLNYITKVLTPYLAKDAAGRPLKALTNVLAKTFQSDAELGAVDSLQNAAMQAVRAMGVNNRFNIQELNMITSAIPKSTDTLGVAQDKVRNLSTMLANAEKSMLGGKATGSPGASKHSGKSDQELLNIIAGKPNG